MSENFIEDAGNEESFLACAAAVTKTIDNLDSYSELMSLIAVRYAETGLLDVAVELAETIADPYSRDQVLANIAAECIEFAENDYADGLLETISDPGLHSMAIEQMAVKYAAVGAFDKAIEIARETDDSGQTLSRIAFIYADGDDFAQALQVARSIEDPGLKATTLTELAAREIRSDRKSEGAELLNEAMKAAEEIEFTQERINALLEIVSLYQESEHEEEAFRLLSRASQAGDELEDAPDAEMAEGAAKDETLVAIAASFARLQRYDRAEALIEKIEDPYQFSAAAVNVALEYHKTNQNTQALALLTEASEVTKEEEVYGARGFALRENLLASLAVAYGTIGHYEDALEIAEMISSPELTYGTLKEVAKTGVRSGNHNLIFRVAELMQDAYLKVLYQVEISDALIEAGQAEFVDPTLSQALEIAETLERKFEKALALMEIALRHARRDQADKASELLFQSLNIAALIGDGYHKARVLIALDSTYRKAGQEPGEREQGVLQEIDSQTENQN
jgi:tetratricopeptide (TPR) repeat protein